MIVAVGVEARLPEGATAERSVEFPAGNSRQVGLIPRYHPLLLGAGAEPVARYDIVRLDPACGAAPCGVGVDPGGGRRGLRLQPPGAEARKAEAVVAAEKSELRSGGCDVLEADPADSR